MVRSGQLTMKVAEMLRFAWMTAIVCMAILVLAIGPSATDLSAAGSHPHLSAAGASGTNRALGSGNLSYNNGPIQRNPVSYLIFWGSYWNNGSGALKADALVAKNYFTDVSGTPFFKILTQYSDTNGNVSSAHTLAGVWLDTVDPATDTTCGGATVQNSAAQAEVSRAIATQGWPTDSVNATYYVFTPSGQYVNDGAGNCSQRQFCSYHNWSTSINAAYAVVAYPLDLVACGGPSSPNGSTQGDSLANLASQIQFAAITNPHMTNGWFDPRHLEINAKCTNSFGSGLVQLNNARTYALQTEYSNSGSTCTSNYVSHFGASPGSFDLTTNTSSASPGAQTLRLSNSGLKPLIWNLTSSLPSWLSLSATSGSTPSGGSQNITLTFSMPPSSSTQYYATTLQFSDSNADNSPLSVPVSVVTANVARTWYFAEGYTGGSFTEYLTIANPNASAANVQVQYFLESSGPVTRSYSLQANSRYTISVNNQVGANKTVSAVVTADLPIIAERPMYFTYGSIPGGSDVLGATALGQNFDFGYLDTSSNHDTWLTILNQNASSMTATIQYFAAGGGAPVTRTHTVAAMSRGTVRVSDEGLIPGSYSALAHLSAPGLIERPMYFVDGVTGYAGSATLVGVPQPLPNWYFAEGFTTATFNERYILSNPSTNQTRNLTVRFIRIDGSTAQTSVTLAPGQQKTVSANAVLGSGGVENSATVQADGPVLAERLMSFRYIGPVGSVPSSNISGATDVLGAAAPGYIFYFAEGYTGGQFGEWVTIQNPDPANTARITVTYLPGTGGTPTIKIYFVAAHSRFTIFANGDMPNQAFSMTVRADRPVVAERPMYFAYNGSQTGGSDIIGYQP
jgi:hypothetical protein